MAHISASGVTFKYLDDSHMTQVAAATRSQQVELPFPNITKEVPINQVIPFPDKAKFLSTPFVASQNDVDNRNGLIKEAAKVTLTKQHEKTTSFEYSKSEAYSHKAGFEVSADFKVFGIGGSSKASYEFTYTTTSTETHGTSTTDTDTFSQEISVFPPKGKVYRAYLSAEVQEVEVPTEIHVVIVGQYDFFNAITNSTEHESFGSICGKIRDHKLAGSESDNFRPASSSDGPYTKEDGVVIMKGFAKGGIVGKFKAYIVDVTDEPDGKKIEDFKKDKIIQTIPFSD